jgi:L-malate glycosyltransferase
VNLSASSQTRVMHVVLSLTPGGAERLVVDLCHTLRERTQPSVCCLDTAGAWAAGLEASGVRIDVLGRQPGFHPSLGWRLAALARRHGAGVLHCHQYSPFVYGSLAGVCAPGLRIVFTEHGRLGDGPPSAKRALVNRVLGRRPDAIVAVSHELRQFMVAEGFPASRVTVRHNGIDPGPEPSPADRARARTTLGLPEDATVIGSVARLDPVKRFDVLIGAFAEVAARDVSARLVIVGGGPERERLETCARACGVWDRVVLTGPRDDARALLPAFDVYTNTSASEGISLTVLEAMAAALPVVATRVGGTPEVLTGETGVLASPGDSHEIASSIMALLASPPRRQLLGAAARARVVERFSLRAMADAYLALYEGRLTSRA